MTDARTAILHRMVLPCAARTAEYQAQGLIVRADERWALTSHGFEMEGCLLFAGQRAPRANTRMPSADAVAEYVTRFCAGHGAREN